MGIFQANDRDKFPYYKRESSSNCWKHPLGLLGKTLLNIHGWKTRWGCSGGAFEIWVSARFLDMSISRFDITASFFCILLRFWGKAQNYEQKLSLGAAPPPNCSKHANSDFKQQFQRGFSNWVIATNFTLTKGSIVQVVLRPFLLHSFWEAPNTAQGQGLTSTSFPFAFGQSAIWGQGSNMSTIRGSAPGSQGDGYLFVTVQIRDS